MLIMAVKKPKKIVVPVFRRPPVVVVLGHVDHGKSSLLEAIKDFRITAKESGGITQHIGAYEVEVNGKHITFIDTPGHEAFSAMRLRGAQVADIALLVVDAAQSVQPQTKEAIASIKQAEIPMIVVMNKIDLPNADPQKIKGELAKAEVYVESMGGEVPCMEVSAKEKIGITELLEMISLVAELQDLSAELNAPAEGLIIESYMEGQKGPVATAIIQKGTLKKKDIIGTGIAVAKVKFLENSAGKSVEEVRPGSPVVILGFDAVPAVGETFTTFASIEEATAKKAVVKREFNQVALDSATKALNIIVKGDVFGSLEAIENMLKGLPKDQVTLNIIKSEVGDINESDVKLAETFRAHVIGFRVGINSGVREFMRKDLKKQVRIKTFDIIYELIQEVRNSMEKSLEAENVRRDVGKIKAIIIFFGEGNRQIVGGKITEGEMKKGLKLDVLRASGAAMEKVGAGRIVSLQRNKKDADLLKKGDECGIMFEGNVKVEQGDILQAYIEERQKGVL